MSREASIISVDIGGATCTVGRVGKTGEVTDVKHRPTEEIRENGLDDFIDLLNEYEEKYIVEGVTIALPSTVDWEDNRVRGDCLDLPWMAEAESLGLMQDRLGRPIQFVNDVEALLVGEWRRGELTGMNSGVVLSLGENMGSALLWGGEPQQGRRGSIMELEHVSLDSHGEEFEDLPPGCARNWLSGKGLRHQLAKRDLDFKIPDIFEESSGCPDEIRKMFELKLAHLMGSIVMMLDPERIVLGGGLTKSYKQWLSPVKQKMNSYVMEQFRGLPVATLGQLRGDDVLLGPAAFWNWQQKGGTKSG